MTSYLPTSLSSRLIDRQFSLGNIFRVKMNVSGPAITHVMFVDDLMIFSKANRREVGILSDCLETYSQWTGQRVNREKSGLIFSKLVQRNMSRWIKAELNMKKLPIDAFYLGSPMSSSKSKTKDFRFLIDKIENRLKGWRYKNISWVGRKTLIKFVAQALPTYAFSTVDILMAVCSKMDSIIRRFWWNPKKDKGNYLGWKAWDMLCLPNHLGGLGFRQSKVFNQALIAKLSWMIVSKRDSLCMCALRIKYKVQADWMRKDPPKSAYPL